MSGIELQSIVKLEFYVSAIFRLYWRHFWTHTGTPVALQKLNFPQKYRNFYPPRPLIFAENLGFQDNAPKSMPKLFSGSTMKMKVDVPCASDALMTNASRLDPQRPLSGS